MRALTLFALLSALSVTAQADINERTHPDPGAQAKINRVIAQAYATRHPPTDHTAVFQGLQPQLGQGLRPQLGQGLSVGLSIGTINASKIGQAPREVNIVTRDNTVVCLHCRGR
jgi:hypothetical protein